MPQSQSLNGLGLSSYKSCACFRRNKMQSFRTSYSSWQHQIMQGIFLAFFIGVLPTKREGILSHVFPSDVYWLQKSPSSLPHSPCQNVTVCFCKTNGSSLAGRVSVLKCAEACWLAKHYILDMAHRSGAGSRREVCPSLCIWWNQNSAFLLSVTCWERATLTCRRKKVLFLP